MSKSPLQPYAELKVKVREYQDEDGKTKGVYVRVGTLFSTPHGSNMAVKLESLPVTHFKRKKGEEEGHHLPWDGWCNVFKIESAEQEIDIDKPKPEDFDV